MVKEGASDVYEGAKHTQNRDPYAQVHKKDPTPKNLMTVESFRIGSISVVILIRTDTTLDHSQKAEKVCPVNVARTGWAMVLDCDVGAHYYRGHLTSLYVFGWGQRVR